MFARAQYLTEEKYEQAVRYKQQFSDAIRQDIFRPSESGSCSDSILVYDAGTGGAPSYRVEEFNILSGATGFILTWPPRVSDGLHYLTSMAGLPDITVPLGQVEFYSQITRTWETLPVSIQLVAQAGCDNMLFDIIKTLTKAGVLRETSVGPEPFK